MNKDVIYIEPEDDITDIINRISAAEQKVVALVPPKNLGILRSAVNTKLIAKTAKAKEKVAVFVTSDTSLVKLAMAAGIPVAKTLQSRPVIPTEEDIKKSAEDVDDIIDEEIDESVDSPAKSSKKPAAKSHSAKVKPDEELNSAEIEEDIEKDEEKGKKKEKAKKESKIPSLDKYRKWIIIGAISGVALIVFLVWAIVFAPAAKVVVSMRTTASNFSENVTFTTTEKDSDAESGKFYLEKQEDKKTESVEFKATGTKNVGERASGTLVVSYDFDVDGDGGTVPVPAGTSFSYNGLAYSSSSATSLSWNGDSMKACKNKSVTEGICTITASVQVSASEAGEKYNINSTGNSFGSSLSGVTATNSSAISGGTDRTVTIVQQSDIDAAKEKLNTESEDDAKKALAKKFSGSYTVIDASFHRDVSDVKSTPAAGEEVGEGVTPKIEVTTTNYIYGVDSTKVEKFIKKKADTPSDQKIYSVGSPFFEKFNADSMSGKLKTTTQIGPKVTEEEVMEKVKGKKVGEVQTLIKSINGVSSVNVETSFFWVRKVPTDENKVTIELKVEE